MAILTAKATKKSELSIDAFAVQLATWADEKKAENIRLYEVQGKCSYADFILICSGSSERHVSAIKEGLRRESKKIGYPMLGSEGQNEGNWVLLDFGDVVVHVFYSPVREYYELDRIWSEANRVELSFPGNEVTNTEDEEHSDTE